MDEECSNVGARLSQPKGLISGGSSGTQGWASGSGTRPTTECHLHKKRGEENWSDRLGEEKHREGENVVGVVYLKKTNIKQLPQKSDVGLLI